MIKNDILMFVQFFNIERISLNDRKMISNCYIAISIIFLVGFFTITSIFESSYALDENKSRLNNDYNGTLMGAAENIFKAIVYVINNSNEDVNGTIALTIDNNISKSNSTNQITFLKDETTILPIEFYSEQLPIGQNYTVEIMYGDDQMRGVEGIINKSGSTEPIQIYLIQPNDTNGVVSVLKARITNENSTDLTGYLQIRIDGTNLEKRIPVADFPAKKTEMISMDFNSKYVPIGKGYNVKLWINNQGNPLASHGVYNPGNDSGIARVTIK